MATVRGVTQRLRHPIRWWRGDLWDGPGTRLLRVFAARYPEAFIIEIGANDGVFHDPLWDYLAASSWRALLVEPQSEPFERLRANYADAADRVIYENVAIATADGPVTLYGVERVEADGSVERIDPLGTISERAVETSSAYFVPDEAQRRVTRTDVDGLTFESLCRRHGVDEVDLVMIDTEGFDLEVLRQVLAGPWRPRLIIYEHLYFSPAEYEEARSVAQQAGYGTLVQGRDTWCLDTRPRDSLTKLWRGLEPAGEPELFHNYFRPV